MRAQAIFGAATLAFLAITAQASPRGSAPVVPAKEWLQAKTPEGLGWSSEKLQRAQEYSKSIGSDAVMIVQDGTIVTHWGDIAKKQNVHSIRKSFLSALYGIAVRDKRISLHATLENLSIDDVDPHLSRDEKQAQVIDLLKARSGVFHAALYETADMKNKPARGSHLHGTFWLYSNWDFNALGTIYEHATNSSIFTQFRQRIAVPLGMQDFVQDDDTGYVSGVESMHAAYPFDVSTRDMARLGLLYLNGGRWGKKQIIPKPWITASTHPYSDGGEKGGYGYLWWCAIDGRLFPNTTIPNGFAAWGTGGHYILVMPDIRTVVVHRVDDQNGPRVTDAQFGTLVQLIREAAPRN